MSLDMRQIPSLDGPLKASRRLSGLVWRSAGSLAKGLRRIESPEDRTGLARPVVLGSAGASYPVRLDSSGTLTEWLMIQRDVNFSA